MPTLPFDPVFWAVVAGSVLIAVLITINARSQPLWRLAGAIWTLVALVSIAYYCFGATDSLVAFWAALLMPLFGLVAILTGLLVVLFVKSSIRWGGIGIAVLLPLAMWFSFQAGGEVSPDRQRTRNAEAIVRSINLYHAATGQYPKQLVDLTPDYLASLPDANSPQGWLYATQNRSFVLGYISGVDKMGYWVCYYTPSAPEQKCDFEAQRWFALSPTPTPE